MRIKKEDSTRERLILAASEVFAKKDYREATIADICTLADANLAAVNYHFRDKETLYREAWRYAYQEAAKAHPIDGGVPDDAPAEDRLRGIIKALILRITDENDKEFWIVTREMSNPTGLLEEVMETELKPLQTRIESVVGALLGADASPRHTLYCSISIINQCHHPILKRISNEDPKKSNRPLVDIPAFIDHVIRFSLGGIRAVAKVPELPIEQKQ